MEKTQTMCAITPESLVKIVKGAVDFAQSFGFPPHADYRHAAMLLAGIDPSTCQEEFTFGRDGKPFYIQGPNESSAQAAAIAQRIRRVRRSFPRRRTRSPASKAPMSGMRMNRVTTTTRDRPDQTLGTLVRSHLELCHGDNRSLDRDHPARATTCPITSV